MATLPIRLRLYESRLGFRTSVADRHDEPFLSLCLYLSQLLSMLGFRRAVRLNDLLHLCTNRGKILPVALGALRLLLGECGLRLGSQLFEIRPMLGLCLATGLINPVCQFLLKRCQRALGADFRLGKLRRLVVQSLTPGLFHLVRDTTLQLFDRRFGPFRIGADSCKGLLVPFRRLGLLSGK